MKETFYFAHDYNAHDDNKLKKIIRKHGAEGFGIYWYLIELLYQETGAWYLPKDYEDYALDLRTESERIRSVVEDFGLFESDGTNFWNNRVDEQIKARIEKSKKASKSAKLRWKKGAKAKDKVDEGMRTHSEGTSVGNAKKGKEKKGKKKKEEDITSSATAEPTPKEIAISFFESPDKRTELAQFISEQKNIPLIACTKEIESFASYWTELNPSGKKQRWEAQKFFDLRKRIGTWFKRANFEMKQDIIF